MISPILQFFCANTDGKIKSVDNGVTNNNDEKPDQLQTETILWQIGPDDYGVATLWARYPDGAPSAFHRR
ncbi:MAG: hypothetical protein ALAOOOJD_04144 [bacterium]|nr:hypothetical protein [bacterium]